MLSFFAIVFLFSIVFNLCMYAVAYVLQTDKITDISYSLTYISIALLGFYQSEKSILDILVLILILVWAIRLGGYLLYRITRIGRDKRFDEIRSKPKSFFGFWIVQGLTCAIVSLAVIHVFFTIQSGVSFLNGVGITISLLGLLVESIADYQKFIYKTKHPNKPMMSGIWKTIRHPNYTGELMFWWGVFILSMSTFSSLICIISPLWITWILLKFSGIPILETKWKMAYGDDPIFNEYWSNSCRLIPFLY